MLDLTFVNHDIWQFGFVVAHR